MRVIGILLIMIALLAAHSATIAWGEGKHTTWNPTAKERVNLTTWMPPNPEDVLIGFEGISMPLGKILLARKGTDVCAIKFTDTWLGETEKDHFSSYGFFYQGDGSGDFTKNNVVTGTGELSFPRIRPIIFDMGYQKGRNTILECGKMKFDWLFIGYLRLDNYELAPTPWTSIKEVNIKDPRVQWYKKDRHRKKITVPIDQLWESPEKKSPPSKESGKP